jgi:SAM-dependent methyltransferase
MSSAREWYRRAVPEGARRIVRRIAREAPIRVVDALPDLRDMLRGGTTALPPPALRASVGIDSSRSHYVRVGRGVGDAILHAATPRGEWLDFGCGSGRIARHLSAIDAITLTGVDVDGRAVSWCAQHLRGDFRVIPPHPPLLFADGSFDVICAVSVFTHLDEAAQLQWLAELRRVLRAGGMLVASTHAPDLTYNRPDLTAVHHQQLATHGFTFIRGSGGFSEESAFHSSAYIQRVWPQFFRSVDHRPHALMGYQDLTICVA